MNQNNVAYVTCGYHRFIKGSELTEVNGYSIYAHRESMRILVYKSRELKHNYVFKTDNLFDSFFNKIIKEARNDKFTTDHKLIYGTILVKHSNLASVADNTVSYYQITEILDINRVKFRKIDQEVVRHKDGYMTSIPLTGVFIGDEIEQRVVSDSIKLDDGNIAIPLEFTTLEINKVCVLKIYKPQSYGLKV